MKKISFFLILLFINLSINAQDSLQQFTGKYIFPDGSVVPDVEVVLTSNALFMTSTAGTSSLTKLWIDTFQIVEFSGTAVFKRGDDKQINAVHIEAMGYILDGQKQSSGQWCFAVCYRPETVAILNRKK